MYRNEAFTYANGTTIEKVFFKVTIFVIGFLVILRIAINASFGPYIINVFNNSTYALAGFIPYFIVSLTVPYTIFNKEYYRLARYYQIPLIETFKFYLSEIYSKKNLIVVFIVPVVIEAVYFLIFGNSNFTSIIVFDTSFLLSIIFVTPTFLLTTFFKKRYIPLKIIVTFFLYFPSIILLIRVSNDFRWYFIPILILFDLLMLIIIYFMITKRDQYLDV